MLTLIIERPASDKSVVPYETHKKTSRGSKYTSPSSHEKSADHLSIKVVLSRM